MPYVHQGICLEGKRAGACVDVWTTAKEERNVYRLVGSGGGDRKVRGGGGDGVKV